VAQPQTRTKGEIEAEIEAARQRLAENVEGLISMVHPKAVVYQGIAEAKAFAATEYADLKAQVVDAEGRLRTERVALIGAAVAGSITFLLIVRSILRGLRR